MHCIVQFLFLFKHGNGGYGLLNLMEYIFGTLKSSLPRLWNLGKQYFTQPEKNNGKNLKKSKQSMLLKMFF